MTFRVHFADGGKIDVEADTPDAARKAAARRYPGAAVTKVKLVRAR